MEKGTDIRGQDKQLDSTINFGILIIFVWNPRFILYQYFQFLSPVPGPLSPFFCPILPIVWWLIQEKPLLHSNRFWHWLVIISILVVFFRQSIVHLFPIVLANLLY